MRINRLASLILSLMLAACATEVDGGDEVSLDESEMITLNMITLNMITLNGLTGSDEALEDLIESPLASATFDPDDGVFPHQLNNADTRMFLAYLAGCALAPEDAPIEFTDINGKLHTFPGALGLCSDWATGPADDDCQEIVSACLFTRNNAKGKSKMISQRGMTLEGVLETAPFVPAKTTTITGAKIPSFGACKVSQSGPSRNCGWTAERSLIGTCTPGKGVTLSCSGVDTTGIAARVCDGIEGCANGSPAVRAQEQTCVPGQSTLSFTCGSDGAYAAMIGPVNSAQSSPLTFTSAIGGSFPATERQVFAIREGAFYGNLFNPAARSPDVTTIILPNGQAVTDIMTSAPTTVFRDAWVCHDPFWSDGAAYLHDRLCAIAIDTLGDQAELCISNRLGPCLGGPTPECAINDVGSNGDMDFGTCVDGYDVVRGWPLTVMLHQPCDLLPPGKEVSCRRRTIPTI